MSRNRLDQLKGMIPLAVSLLLVGFSVDSAWAQAPTAEELLTRSIAYHDPQGRFLTEAHRLQFLETRPDGADRHSEVLVDVAGGRFHMKRAGEHEIAGVLAPGKCEMTLDGRSEVSEEERAEHRLSCERLQQMRNYYTYLWGLPMKLRDPGTILGRVTSTTFEEKPVYDLKVTYDEGIGADVWYFYFDRESYALIGYRFYHDEAKNDGEVILLAGEEEAEGLRLPKSRTWRTHQDDRLLGTDSLLSVMRPTPVDHDKASDVERE